MLAKASVNISLAHIDNEPSGTDAQVSLDDFEGDGVLVVDTCEVTGEGSIALNAVIGGQAITAPGTYEFWVPQGVSLHANVPGSENGTAAINAVLYKR